MSQTDKHLYNSGPSTSAQSQGSSQGSGTRSLHQAKVVEILQGHRLRVRIDGIDNRLKDADLPICAPLLPLFFKVNPEFGEVVDVFLPDTSQPFEDRRWMGPTITQYNYLDGQPYLPSTVAVNREGFYKQHESENPRTRPEAKDLFSDEKNSREQVWYGRGNTDILQSNRQIRLRAGKAQKGKRGSKNLSNPATMALHVTDDGLMTALAAVADKFYFLGHNGTPLVAGTRTGEITDELLKQMEAESHPGTLTNNLIDFLDLFRRCFLLHAHGYDGMTLLKTELMKRLEEFDLSLLASKTMRIN